MNSLITGKEQYWDRYYSKIQEIEPPSPFAEFCSQYIGKDTVILEAGFGTGRDSVYFSSLAKKVIAIDISKEAYNFVKNIAKDYDNIQFRVDDFTAPKEYDYLGKGINLVYSRWTLHAINSEGENRFLKLVSKILQPGNIFCIECRSTKDGLFGKGEKISENEFIYSHYRRFITRSELEKKLKSFGFEIIFSTEGYGFSKVGDDDPHLIRIIARKQNTVCST